MPALPVTTDRSTHSPRPPLALPLWRTSTAGQRRSKPLAPQNLLHLLPPRQFVDQLVEIAQFAHQRVFDRFDPDAADHPSDQRPRGVQLRRLREEIFEIRSLRQRALQRFLAIPRQPAENLVDLRLRPPLLLRLGDIMRVNTRDAGRKDAVFGHRSLHGGHHNHRPPLRHPGLDPGSTAALKSWMPDQVRHDEELVCFGVMGWTPPGGIDVP